MMRSDPFEEVPIVGRTFENPDTFAQYAITQERELLNCPDPGKQRNGKVPIIGLTFEDPDIYEKELLNRLEPYELQHGMLSDAADADHKVSRSAISGNIPNYRGCFRYQGLL